MKWKAAKQQQRYRSRGQWQCRSVQIPTESESFFRECEREQHRIIGAESVEITYSVRDLRSTITQSHLSSPSLAPACSPPPPSTPAGPSPNQVRVFCSFNKRTEGENDVALLVVWINVKGDFGWRRRPGRPRRVTVLMGKHCDFFSPSPSLYCFLRQKSALVYSFLFGHHTIYSGK